MLGGAKVSARYSMDFTDALLNRVKRVPSHAITLGQVDIDYAYNKATDSSELVVKFIPEPTITDLFDFYRTHHFGSVDEFVSFLERSLKAMYGNTRVFDYDPAAFKKLGDNLKATIPQDPRRNQSITTPEFGPPTKSGQKAWDASTWVVLKWVPGKSFRFTVEASSRTGQKLYINPSDEVESPEPKF